MRPLETETRDTLLCRAVESGGGHEIPLDTLLATEPFEVFPKDGSRGEVVGLVVDKRDVVFFFGAAVGGAVVSSAEAEGGVGVVKHNGNPRIWGGDEALEDPAVGFKGVGVGEVLSREGKTLKEELPMVDEFFTTGDTEDSHWMCHISVAEFHIK